MLPPASASTPTSAFGDLLRTTARHRPSDDVGEHAEHQSVAGGDGAVEREDRVSGEAGEQATSLVGVEPSAGDTACVPDPGEAVAGQRERMAWRDREG